MNATDQRMEEIGAVLYRELPGGYEVFVVRQIYNAVIRFGKAGDYGWMKQW